MTRELMEATADEPDLSSRPMQSPIELLSQAIRNRLRKVDKSDVGL